MLNDNLNLDFPMMKEEDDNMVNFKKQMCLPRPVVRLLKRFSALVVVLMLLSISANYYYRSLGPNYPLPTTSLRQKNIDYIAKSLVIEYFQRNSFIFDIILLNNGTRSILKGDWEIYFSQVTPFLPDITYGPIFMKNINGFLFKLIPNPNINGHVVLAPMARTSLVVNCYLSSKHFVFPNWFIVNSVSRPQIISSTSSTSSREITFAPASYSSSTRYVTNDDILNSTLQNLIDIKPKLVVPTPIKISRSREDHVTVMKDWVLSYNSLAIKNEALFLADVINMKDVQILSPDARKSKIICLELGDIVNDTNINDKRLLSDEAYKLSITDDRIVVGSKSSAGVFYAIQTFLNLLHRSFNGKDIVVPILEIVDAPRYKYRGLLIDVARHFLNAQFIAKIIKVMSSYKMNYLHLHLTDDEGWRIQIPSIPELTRVGAYPSVKWNARRKYDFLNAYLGNVPNKPRQFYTSDIYKKLLAIAARHYVTIIPELDFPGHSHAALVSMRARKRHQVQLGLVSKETSYDIEDEDDDSVDASVNNVSDTVLNICLNSTIEFIRTVVGTLVDYHKDIQPLKLIHLGGDEVSETSLLSSPVCKKLLGHYTNSKIEAYTMTKLIEIGSEFNLKVILWEGKERRTGFTGPHQPVLHYWLPSDARDEVVTKYLNAGLDVILSEASTFYLDHPTEPCFFENGLRWATPSINEFNIFSYTPPAVCLQKDPKCDVTERKKQIFGMQANLWGELILKEEMAEMMLFPRLLAFAERAWHQAEWEDDTEEKEHSLAVDWLSFAKALVTREFNRLEQNGIRYRVPPPGARLRQGQQTSIKYNTMFPGLKVVASQDEGKTWIDPNQIRDSFQNVLLKTLSADGKRESRTVDLAM